MKIVQFEEPGTPEVLHVKEVPLPEPGAAQIRVKAHSIGVGIPDVLIRSGAYSWMPPLPCIPGTEMSGTVSAIGPDVGNVTVGDRVYVSARERPRRGGCYADEIVVRADEITPIPEGADMEAVATLANYQVAWHLLWNMARVKAGDTVLVYAAAGGVGSAIVELALIADAKVIGVASGTAKGAFVKDMGATHVVDRGKDDVVARVKEATGGRGVDFVFDPAGGPEAIHNAAMLAPLGTLIVYGRLAGSLGGDIAGAIRDRFGDSIGLRAFSIHSFDHDKPRRLEATEAAMILMAKGALKPGIHARLPLADARKAHEMLEAGIVIGKILLKPEDPA
jgi:NADPH2:quinone reductase